MAESFWPDRTVLVTGATGLLGSCLVRRLFELSADLVCLVRGWVPQSEMVRAKLIERVKVVRGDVRGQAFLEGTLGISFSAVFRLVRSSVSKYYPNSWGWFGVLRAVERMGTTRARRVGTARTSVRGC
jgi:UDP-glucose 4-epimerase